MLGAPLIAEFVSGSTAPQAWLLPWVPLTFMGIYGVAALVIRDYAIRLRGGAVAVLVLGLAFGVVNEGMAAHSLFDPNWPGVGVLASYGRWEGVSWLWAEWIVVFHAVWSISFPIFLARQCWPEVRDVRFLSDRSLVMLAPVPIVVAIASSFAVGNLPLSLVQWAGLFLATLAFVLLATALAGRRLEDVLARFPSPPAWLAACAGFLFFVAGQVGTWQSPRLGPYPAVPFAVGIAVDLLFMGFVLLFHADPAGERARFAFVLGGIAFYVALSPVWEFFLDRIALFPIDVAVLAALVLLYRRRTSRPGPTRDSGPGAATGS